MMWVPDWIVAILVIAGGLYIYGMWNLDFFKKRKFPFVASPKPFVGNMGPIVFKKLTLPDHIKAMYDTYKNYKYVGFYEFTNPVVMIRDPEMVKMITVKDFDHFVDRVVPIGEDIDSFFGKNILALQGQRWKDMRGTLSPAFTSSKMKAMFALVSESGEQLAHHLDKCCKGAKNGQVELDMKDFFTRYANDVIATSAFGISCDSLKDPENEFYTSGKKATKLSATKVLIFFGYRTIPAIMKFLGFSFLPESTKKFFRSLVVGTMEVREKEGIIRPDMVHLLMQAKKGTLINEDSDATENPHVPSKKMELSDDDITAQAFLFFVAGFDTVSTHLCFLSNLLATYPDIQMRVQDEIDTVLKAHGGKPTYESIHQMKYLDMCVSEALRLWPPGVVTDRQCVKPYVLPATENTPHFTIEKGHGVWIPVFGIHRDPKYFPDPERFDPERFSDENKHNIQPYTYMPFGTGPRNCIGMRFALMEVKTAMVSLLARFNLEVTSKTPTNIVLDKKAFGLEPEGGFWLGISPRTKE